MKYIIIEDEQLAARRLQELITVLRPDYQLIAHMDAVESAVEELPELTYDLLLMDIQLADGLSFDILDQVEVESPIIFTTAFDEYAIRAFKANSVDYLLKPIDRNELEKALFKFEKGFQQQTASNVSSDQLSQLLKALKPQGKERFVVRVGEHLKMIDTNDVQLVFSRDKGTYVLVTDGRKYLIDYTIDKVESLLAPSRFFRISRKFIVALPFIQDLVVYTNSRLQVIIPQFDEEPIIVSRERVNDFKDWLDR